MHSARSVLGVGTPLEHELLAIKPLLFFYNIFCKFCPRVFTNYAEIESSPRERISVQERATNDQDRKSVV